MRCRQRFCTVNWFYWGILRKFRICYFLKWSALQLECNVTIAAEEIHGQVRTHRICFWRCMILSVVPIGQLYSQTHIFIGRLGYWSVSFSHTRGCDGSHASIPKWAWICHWLVRHVECKEIISLKARHITLLRHVRAGVTTSSIGSSWLLSIIFITPGIKFRWVDTLKITNHAFCILLASLVIF